MKNELIKFLSQFPELNEIEIKELSEMMTVKAAKKNTVILEENQYCNLCFFVLKGCLKQYVIIDGIEKTTNIYTENQAINFFSDQLNQKPSESFISCIEDSILLVGNPEKDEHIYNKFPVLLEITRKMIESDFGKTQVSFSKFKTSTPEERYLDLLNERPEILQRVPQNIIASYLGITPESLSRIRKRILAK